MLDELKEATRNVVNDLSVQVEAARRYERQLIAGGMVPDNYWQPRHKLERKLEAATKILDILHEH